MKGDFRKDYKFSIILTEEDLKSLLVLINNGFKDVCYEIRTKDGADYNTSNLKDILEFTNPDCRKIEILRVRGNLEKGESFFLSNICVSLFDTSVYDKSIIIELNRMEEKDIIYYSNLTEEFAKKVKAPYWWIHKNSFYWIVGIFMYFVLSICYLSKVDNTETINKVYNILLMQGLSGLCVLFSMTFLNKIVSYFYPESCFAFGEQKRYIQKKEKARYILIWTIACALIISILSGVIVHFITKLYLN